MSTARLGGDETLVLFGGYLPADALGWARVARNGDVREQGGASDETPEGATTARTILVLSAAETQLKRLQIPARSEAQARAAAAHLFRGAVAASADSLHFAVGEAQDHEGARLVAAIDRDRLKAWIAACGARAAEPRAILVDAAIWPAPEDGADIIDTQSMTLVAGGALGGAAIEKSLAATVLPRWIAANANDIRRIRIDRASVQTWAQALDPRGPKAETADLGDPIDVLAQAVLAPPEYAPDLRQGAFAVEEKNQSPWRVWRFAAALALLALGLQIGSLVVAGMRDDDAAKKTLARAEEDFRKARPDVQRVVNLRAQVEGQMNALRLASSHPVLRATDPLRRMLQDNPEVRLDELRHAAPERAVHVRLSAERAASLEAGVAALRANGARFETQTLDPVEGRPTAQLTLETQS